MHNGTPPSTLGITVDGAAAASSPNHYVPRAPFGSLETKRSSYLDLGTTLSQRSLLPPHRGLGRQPLPSECVFPHFLHRKTPILANIPLSLISLAEFHRPVLSPLPLTASRLPPTSVASSPNPLKRPKSVWLHSNRPIDRPSRKEAQLALSSSSLPILLSFLLLLLPQAPFSPR
ncbi:hypothetical protein LZ30DRAFT_90633 [Colletotrichum cereale]|nr:hypothetical protein LZ30DRAFT_90633 [Colletotrichum cereale]